MLLRWLRSLGATSSVTTQTRIRNEIRAENLTRICNSPSYVRAAGTHTDSELRRLRARVWTER